MRSSISLWYLSCIPLMYVFYMLIWHLCVFYGEVSFFSNLFPNFNSVGFKKHYCFEIPYILWIQVLYQLYKVQICSPNMWLFILLAVFLKISKSHLPFFPFMNCTFGVIPKKSFINRRSQKCSDMFSFRSFI